jgi:hypothetical protein
MIDRLGLVCEKRSVVQPTPPPVAIKDPIRNPTPGDCTRWFIQWRGGNDIVPLDKCIDIMGLKKYCADHGSFVAVAQTNAGRAMVCAPYSKKDSQLEQAKHIIRGVEQGTAEAFVAAAPFFGPATEALACSNGIIYACVVLAVDLAQLGTKQQVAGLAGDAIVLSQQAGKCAGGDVGACAQIGARGAARAGLNIPGKDPAKVAAAAQKCKANDHAACTELGQDAVDAGGLGKK